MVKYTHVIVHYDEIGLKGKNRGMFEEQLARNIRVVAKGGIGTVKREYGQIILGLRGHDPALLRTKLKRIPGIAFFSFAIKTERDMDEMKNVALAVLKEADPESFKIESVRHNKTFPITSPVMNREIGAFVQETSGKRVDLTKPELTICVEICDKNAFVSKEKILGVGGLPVGSAGRVVCLISGGIDSPVAAYMMMNRGAEVVFVHFQNDTQMKHSVERKIAALVRILSAYQGESKLYIVPFGDVQRNIIIGVNSRIRMLIYRRFMVRIACEIAKLEGAKALVLGDSLSQVASQTLENINTVYAVSDRAILSPLIGFNKKDTVALAKKMGTYESSILPYGDCCSFMIAEHPVTHASIEEAARAEDTLDIERLVKSALEKKTEQLVSPDNPASCI